MTQARRLAAHFEYTSQDLAIILVRSVKISVPYVSTQYYDMSYRGTVYLPHVSAVPCTCRVSMRYRVLAACQCRTVYVPCVNAVPCTCRMSVPYRVRAVCQCGTVYLPHVSAVPCTCCVSMRYRELAACQCRTVYVLCVNAVPCTCHIQCHFIVQNDCNEDSSLFFVSLVSS